MRIAILVFLSFVMGCSSMEKIVVKPRPIVIGHRGAPGYRPEHTLASYQLAIEQNADFIEPDVVMTKDGVLICRHENEIGGTTDVATKFPKRRRTKTIDGVKVTGWFTEDFTLEELKTLKVKERLPHRDHQYDGQFEIPTFAEVLELIIVESKKRGRRIGVYPETKHPSYFASIGLPLEEELLKQLKTYNLDDPKYVFIQSFEISNLKKLNQLTDIPLIQLIGGPGERPYDVTLSGSGPNYRDMLEDAGLAEIKTYADGIGPWKGLIVGESSTESFDPSLVTRTHKAGLKVHAYTFRSDKENLPEIYAGNWMKEYHAFFELGVDGVFSDFPDHARKARDLYFKR